MTTIKNYELRIKRLAVSEQPAGYGRCVNGPTEVARLAGELIGDLTQEVFLIFHLDSRNKLLGFTEVGRGGMDRCPVDLRSIFRSALAVGSASILAVHNHPSGDTDPSPEDQALTRRLKSAADLLGLPLVDHVIVSRHSFTSLRERGGDW
jgi:DNA repair protein RadC